MDEKEYGYTAQAKTGSHNFSYRPLIDTVIGSKTKSRKFKALVDSGTDVTVMDKNIARLLDIEEEGKERAWVTGIEFNLEGFIAPVSLQFDKFDATYNFSVLFVENMSKNFDIILGQQDFFLNFEVRFHRPDKKFYLSQVEPDFED